MKRYPFVFFGVDCVDAATDEAKKVRTAENSERLNQTKFTELFKFRGKRSKTTEMVIVYNSLSVSHLAKKYEYTIEIEPKVYYLPK